MAKLRSDISYQRNARERRRTEIWLLPLQSRQESNFSFPFVKRQNMFADFMTQTKGAFPKQ